MSKFKKLIISPNQAFLIQNKTEYNKLLSMKNTNLVTDSNECYDIFGFIWFDWLEISEETANNL